MHPARSILPDTTDIFSTTAETAISDGMQAGVEDGGRTVDELGGKVCPPPLVGSTECSTVRIPSEVASPATYKREPDVRSWRNATTSGVGYGRKVAAVWRNHRALQRLTTVGPHRYLRRSLGSGIPARNPASRRWPSLSAGKIGGRASWEGSPLVASPPHGHGKSYFLRAFPAHMWRTGTT
jgi:hypothetical protein